jgi:hypothetical protein
MRGGLGLGLGLGLALVLALALVGAGCGRVHDLGVPSVPIVTFHGHVDLASLEPPPQAPLIGALVWAAVAAVNPVCLPAPPTGLEGECADPYGVFDGEVGSGVPIDASGDFDVTLLSLPKASLAVGDSVTRISYGSLIVVEDLDGDGQPSFPMPVVGGQGPDLGAPTAATSSDRIVGATFWSLNAPQQRIVFREGDFVSPSNFYPACAWTGADPPNVNVPPPGFSILGVPPRTDPLPPPEACSVASPDVRVTVAPISAAEGLGMICRPVQLADASFRRLPSGSPIHQGEQIWCSGDNSVMARLFTGDGRVCASLRSYTLHCALDPGCATPGSDFVEPAPSWWPCP